MAFFDPLRVRSLLDQLPKMSQRQRLAWDPVLMLVLTACLAAPKQLYLGCRFSRVNTNAAAAAAKFCDVVSYNLTGRVYDEENCQIGFVDVADTPYPEIVGAARATAGAMYQLRANP